LKNDSHPSDHPGAVHDPVCGMSVEPQAAQHRTEHAGRSYLFCSSKCRERFIAEPRVT